MLPPSDDFGIHDIDDFALFEVEAFGHLDLIIDVPVDHKFGAFGNAAHSGDEIKFLL